MKLFANIISAIFHPLMIITYGVALMLSYTYLVIYPPMMKLLLLGVAFLCTAVIPGLFVLLMKYNGSISNLEMPDRRERAVPLLVFFASTLVFLFFVRKMQAPFWSLSLLLGVAAALLLAMCINFFWKISIHGIGMGGLLGGVMGVSCIHLLNPSGLLVLLFIIAGLVATSRIILERHTPMQAYAGICLGFICTFTAVLFIFN